MTVAGIAGVQARIADIENRFGPPQQASFAGALARATTPAVPPLDGAPAPANPPMPPPAADPATAVAALTAAPPAASPTAGVPPAPGQPAGTWAQRLPDAGRAWAPQIAEAAAREGVDPPLLAALVWAESGFRAEARSHAGAIGLAQLMPGTARGLGVDPHDPVQNLQGGARYLREQLDRFGSVDLALAAYNAGPGRVAQAGGVPAIAETRAYVPRVLDYYARLR